ncbi:MAG: DUF1194 domain-containing protein [Paracoccaceae bacterium]
MLFRTFTLVVSLAFIAPQAQAQAQSDCADLALVLAIDSSGSISAQDFALQRQGYAAAFADPFVQSALQSAGVVDVALVLWGDSEMAPQVSPWMRIAHPDDALQVMGQLMYVPRTVSGNTGIGRGVTVALDMLEDPAQCAVRRVINVSGDGQETLTARPVNHVPLAIARQRAADMGVIINALAITRDDPDLAGWYRDHLITGSGAFVMSANDFGSFGAAIIQKLGREIAPPQLAQLVKPPVQF